MVSGRCIWLKRKPIDCRHKQDAFPTFRVSVRWMLGLVPRSIATALKCCRWSARMWFALSSAHKLGGLQQACQNLTAHTDACLLGEVFRDVEISRISIPMMSNTQCLTVSCWTSYQSGDTTVTPESSDQRFASQHSTRDRETPLNNTSHNKSITRDLFSESLQRGKKHNEKGKGM